MPTLNRKKSTFLINNLIYTLKKRGLGGIKAANQTQSYNKGNKGRTEINKKTENQQRKINGIKSRFFEKINEIDKPLTRLREKKRRLQLITL